MHLSKMISRRRTLQILGWSGMSAALVHINPGTMTGAGTDSFAAFEEVPPATSGISWVPVSGQSPEMYFPETVGPGCAVLDYDNDSWMDSYLGRNAPGALYSPAT